MGCGGSIPVSPESREIDRQLKEAEARAQREIKLLLLGTGGSGKSTVAKQMKILHMSGYTEQERLLFVEFIYMNILNGFKALVRALDDAKMELPEHADVMGKLRVMTVHHGNVEMNPAIGEQLQALWSVKEVRQVFRESPCSRSEEHVIYFLDSLNRCCADHFVPTTDDVLHVRMKTTGIKETCFAHEGFTFRVVDVGGQKSERRKWIHCFQDVTAVLFVVSLADYNLSTEEDATLNRLTDSLDLFNKVVNNNWFKGVDIVLFLNKRDVFDEKIERVSITVWPDFKGKDSKDADEIVEYITKRFMSHDKGEKRSVYKHVTTATDTKSIEKVWVAVRAALMKESVTSGVGFEL